MTEEVRNGVMSFIQVPVTCGLEGTVPRRQGTFFPGDLGQERALQNRKGQLGRRQDWPGGASLVRPAGPVF